jgi:hypothetical protein
MVYDSRRYSALIKLLKSCIFFQNANKNILPTRDASCCSREAWKNLLKCHKIVTVDSSTQSATIAIPLQGSAVGFSRPEWSANRVAQCGSFFACIAWHQMVAGQGHLRVCRCSIRSTNPVRSTTPFSRGVADCKPQMEHVMPNHRSGTFVPYFSVRCPFLGHSLVNRLSNGGRR